MEGMRIKVRGTGADSNVSWDENIPSLLVCPSCHKTDGGMDGGWVFNRQDFSYLCIQSHCGYKIPLKDLCERDLFWVKNTKLKDIKEDYGFLVYGNRPVKVIGGEGE